MLVTFLLRTCNSGVSSDPRTFPSCVLICNVCTCRWDENVEWHLSEIYSIFYLYLKVDVMKRQANECCDVVCVQKYLLMTSPGIFSRLIIVIVLWQRWLLYEMLIISDVENMLKAQWPYCCMTIFIFISRVCVHVLACHSGFLEGYYFSMIIRMLFGWRIEVTSVLAGWADPQDVRGRAGDDDDDDEEETGRCEEASDGERK